MTTKKIKVAYFSPTGTTKAVAQCVAENIDHGQAEEIDITKASMRKQQLQVAEDELLIVAVPVYMGRVPEVISSWLHKIQADKTPTVCIAVYGNRAYEDTLLEMSDILKECGCIPFAGAAFIGEHSFSHEELPIAAKRPDGSDLKKAAAFGKDIKEKLHSMEYCEVTFPGERPYRGKTQLWSVDFIDANDTCTQCGICAENCPVDAISFDDNRLTDKEKCITCCACIKGCPEKAKTIKPGPVKDAAIRLNSLCKERKEPEQYL